MDVIQIQKLNCNRCNHIWIPRTIPVQCPRCHSYFWNEDKDYDRRKQEFKNKKFEFKKIIIKELKGGIEGNNG